MIYMDQMLHFSKIDNYKMALLAYVHALGQTTHWFVDLTSRMPHYRQFAARQLQYGAMREYYSTFTTNGTDSSSFTVSTLHMIFGDDFEKNHQELQNYIRKKNHSSVYDYL